MFLIIILGLLAVAFYFYGTRNHDYWKKKGVTYEEPLFLFGSNLKQLTEGVSVAERFSNLYRSYPYEKYVGLLEGSNPALLLRDPKIIKRVLQTDFKHFHYRGLLPDREHVETLLRNLFFADGDIWKLMRQKLTPMFSSGKLKAMFALIIERADRLTEIAEELSSTRDEVDVRELMARYTTDVIGACGFGINSEALSVEDSEFRRLGKRIFQITKRDFIVSLVKRMYPALTRSLHFLSPEIEKKSISIITQIMSERNYKPSGRNDFIDMMLELRQKEVIVGESLSKTNADGSPMQVELVVDDLLLVAQVFVFFGAGYETSSHTSSFLLHLLAYHPEKQARCQREIEQVLKSHNGKLTFDSVKEMKYLEMCLMEALRILPSLGFLLRRSVSKYTFPETNLTIDENVLILIPIHALHNDEQYFESASEFRPERFETGNVSKFEKDAYMPFGTGPRACIGERMGILQSMAGAAAILNKFTLSPSKSSVEKPVIIKSSTITQNIEGGLPLSLKLRN